MAVYKDIISYKLADTISEAHLLKVAGQIVNDWMAKQSGFIKWEIHKDKDGNYTDIVYWESEAAAKEAEANMVNIPNAADWYGCYKPETITSKNLHRLAEF
ncbi:MAG: hypothetical protein KDD94_07605 [Calditrichaeota bacterium]|nr:hypothetical protein [Calditrichota bacterium]